MPSLHQCKTVNAAFDLSYISVAIFVGGTSGIGQATSTAEACAQITGGNAHIVIIGRNEDAAHATISRFPEATSPQAVHESVHCDVSSLRRIHAVTTKLKKRLTKVHYLILSAGILDFYGRIESEEGLDRKMVLNYCSRWKFIRDLLPLLQAAKDFGEEVVVESVYSCGCGAAVSLDDLGLRKTYTAKRAIEELATYTDLMMEVSSPRRSRLPHSPPHEQFLSRRHSRNSDTLLPNSFTRYLLQCHTSRPHCTSNRPTLLRRHPHRNIGRKGVRGTLVL